MPHTSDKPTVDLAFLTYWTPARLMLTGIGLYAFALLISPLEYDWAAITLSGSAYAIVVIAVFLLGCVLAGNILRQSAPLEAAPLRVPLDRYIYIAIAIAAAGILARLYDRVYLRGFAFEETLLETRASLDDEATGFGYFGGFAFTFGTIALLLVWLSRNQRRHPVIVAVAGLLAIYPMMEGLVQGSRSTAFHTILLLYFFARATGAMRWLTQSPVKLLVLGIFLLFLSSELFEIRTLQTGGYDEIISEVYRLSGSAQYARAPDWITNAIIASDGEGVVADFLKTWTHTLQYLTHSFIAYFDNIARFDGEFFGWGRLHFGLPLRVVSSIFRLDIVYDPIAHGMLDGIYSTAISYIYYDFGPLGPIVAGLYGFAATFVYASAVRLPERWLPLHACISLGIVSTLIDNELLGGLGAFAIWAAIGYAAIHYVVSVLSPGSAEVQSLQAAE